MFQFVLNTPLEDHKSSNVNEVIRAVLNSLYFFTKRFRTHQKHKSINTQSSKSTKRYKRTKIQNALKKHLRGRKSLICLFAFLCFLCARRKENRKKKIEKTEKSPQCRCTKYRWPHNQVHLYLHQPSCGDSNLVYISTS